MRAKIGPTAAILEVDELGGSSALVPAITTGNTLTGNLSDLNAGWHGRMRNVYVTSALTTTEAEALRSYVLARR